MSESITTRSVTAVAHGGGSTWPESVTVTIDGVVHVIDVTGDRDDWDVPSDDVPDDVVRILWAIDDAIEVWRAANEPESTRLERTWARSVAR
jgi:hypothetical protein